MSKPLRKPQEPEPPLDQAATDPEQFLREFRRRMAEQGVIVRMANAQPGWEPAITLDVPAEEVSAMVVRLRRGEV